MLDPLVIVGCAVGLAIADLGFALYRTHRARALLARRPRLSAPIDVPPERVTYVYGRTGRTFAPPEPIPPPALVAPPDTELARLCRALSNSPSQYDQNLWAMQQNTYGRVQGALSDQLPRQVLAPPATNAVLKVRTRAQSGLTGRARARPDGPHVVVNLQTGIAESLWNSEAEAAQHAADLNRGSGVWAIQPCNVAPPRAVYSRLTSG